ncbi:MAG: fructose-6-phosphate aldolase [candidate division WOR-3 bacterium]
MKLFIDTANLDDIREIASWGVLSGATTNPTLLARERGTPEEVLKEICEIVKGPVSAEVVATETKDMIAEGRRLAAIHDNIVVKIPMIPEGLAAVSALSSEGIACNMTLIFSAPQAILAARAGAKYVSPFVGRLDDIGEKGMDVVEEIAEIFAISGIEAEIITASVRHPRHVVEAALAGSHIATIPPAVFRQMVKHPLTDRGLEIFLNDWKARFGKPKEKG